MIDVKQAIEAAKKQAVEFIVPAPASLRLEEIERENYQSKEAWSITFSFPDPDSIGPFSVRREYRRFLVDAENGSFLAMKRREVAVP
ncbi:MAG: hypothetical protein SFV51_29165 [Bryobacteraceae bacterium]|nr:hypothetical protein [Bryobacteraceae bacterium]